MTVRRQLVRIAVIIAGFYGAVVTALFLFQGFLLFPAPNRAIVAQPGFELVRIESAQGRELLALYRAVPDPRATIIFFHGNASIASDEQRRGAALAAEGFNVLLAGYSGYGGSDGEPSAANLMDDAMASYAWAAQQSAAPIVLYGSSLGTGLAVHLAARQSVAALVLEAPYDELVAVAQRHYPWVPVRPLFRNNTAPVNEIGSIDVPILIMHGTRDATIPIAHGQALASAGGDTIEFEVFEGAGHSNLVASGSLSRAIAFLEQVAPR